MFIFAGLFVWRYRANGGRGKYTPDWSYSARIDAVIWLVPALIVAALGYLLWTTTHKLDPYRSIGNPDEAIVVQAVAQDWKWLFLYPQLGIATVNELAFPSDKTLALRITSDTVMNSFMIPSAGRSDLRHGRHDEPPAPGGR